MVSILMNLNEYEWVKIKYLFYFLEVATFVSSVGVMKFLLFDLNIYEF